MCETCGCGEPSAFRITKSGHEEHAGNGHEHTHPHSHDEGHAHDHNHDHEHPHESEGRGKRILMIEKDILHENDLMAQRNRGYFEAKKVCCINMVSSPGSGKTTILEKTIAAFKGMRPVYVIEGDQQSMLDADRLAKLGIQAVQINTGSGCHLDANMVNRALKSLDPAPGALLFIENVGNLVCPALFDLGETSRVLVMSVTEGEDKPLKYPAMFRSAHLCLINKTDLLPYVDFRVDVAEKSAGDVNPSLQFLRISATTGDGLPAWYEWISSMINSAGL